MNRLSKKGAIVLLIFALLTVIAFKNMGLFLVRTDPLDKAGLIVVLMGGGPDRILQAVDIYNEGYANKILMVENEQPGFRMLDERGVSIPREASLWKSVGMQLGIPEDDFVIIPGDAQSTRDEAVHIGWYLKEHRDIHSIILVSARSHTSRAAKIFERQLNLMNSNVTIVACPSCYDNFNEKRWWKSRTDAGRVVDEYIRFLAFYTIDRLP